LEPVKQYDEKKELLMITRGNEEAFANFYNRYRGKIYGVALKMLKSTALAEDTVQEVFLKIWLKREELIHIERIEGYLFIITRNHILNTLKILAKEESLKDNHLSIPGPDDNTDYLTRENQYAGLLNDVIDKLPPQQNIVFRLSRNEGLSTDEIATKLSLSPLTVKKHLSQALKFIRKNTRYLRLLTILLSSLAAR
jgi:RNA polymerase sigma-70 factor (ECF subfamily)